MILTVEEFRRFYQTDETDFVLQAKLDGITQMVKNYTHNNFRKYMVDGVIQYPADIKMGVVNLMKWELENREKAGIQSETISRHTVNYLNLDYYNSAAGYPKSLMGFLRPYMRARFGQGLSV